MVTRAPRGRSMPQSEGLLAEADDLLFSDDLEHCVRLCDRTVSSDGAGAVNGDWNVAPALRTRWAHALLQQGKLREAVGVADQVLQSTSSPADTLGARAVIAECFVHGDDLPRAERTLMLSQVADPDNGVAQPFLLHARAQLRLTQSRPSDAADDALRAGTLLTSRFEVHNPGVVPWRSTAGFALLATGDRETAMKLALEENDLAHKYGVVRAVIRAQCVMGLATGAERGISYLQAAVALGRTCPPRLESLRARLELGAALRRCGQRTHARAVLREALMLSQRGGIAGFVIRARAELDAAGARPRRVAVTGVDALTPSERRVAGLAAEGLTTRQMARVLFVTPKTIEFHLRHTYQKLAVSSRAELAASLADRIAGEADDRRAERQPATRTAAALTA